MRDLGSKAVRAFTIVELLVAVSVMTLIILVLYGMFDQVQKALRGNVAQVDVLEGGRAAVELMTREMEQIVPGNTLSNVNLFVSLTVPPLVQELDATNVFRTNYLQQIYFLTRFNKDWFGTGYRVMAPPNAQGHFQDVARDGVGSLARFSVPLHTSNLARSNLYGRIMAGGFNLTNYQRVADGVVHLRFRAYDANGVEMIWRTNNHPWVSLLADPLDPADHLTAMSFTNTAVPSYLELEMGILEPHALERYRSMGNSEVARDFLRKQTGKIHLFQQRIPVRTAPR